MSNSKTQDNSRQPSLGSWIKTENGKRALAGALERSQKETSRLKEARSIDPKKLEDVITH